MWNVMIHFSAHSWGWAISHMWACFSSFWLMGQAWTLWLYRGNVSLLCGTSSLCSESISIRCSTAGWRGLLRVEVRWVLNQLYCASMVGALCSRFRSILETGQRSGLHSGSLLGWWRRRVQAGWGALSTSSAAGFLLRQPWGPGCSGWGRAPPGRIMSQGGAPS